jgi:hypothetical protein
MGMVPLLAVAEGAPAGVSQAGVVEPGVVPANVVRAGDVNDRSVTIYRSPNGVSGSLDLNELGGFALVTETRTVFIPAGESRVRFEGVADGIEPASAIITGLPAGVLEKNHDAQVLSPSELVKATLGRSVSLVRTDPKTGKVTDTAGTLVSDAEGVLFKSEKGEIEALRCSGWPETFHFDAATDATATPTLAALIRSPGPATATVRLSYLTRGFDWLANYVATVSPDSSRIDLGAWVTLANSNSVSFPESQTQVVAGRLNRESEEVEPVDPGSWILAECWPSGTTSDGTALSSAADEAYGADSEMITVTAQRKMMVPAPMMAIQAAAAAAPRVEQEQLGDLKLYRVPWRTSVTSRQIKQVRLLDRQSIPVKLIYGADITANIDSAPVPLRKVLRTRNDRVHHLALPLPSGRVAAFYEHGGTPLLVSESSLRDVAVDEEFEIDTGDAPDVEVTAGIENWKFNLEKQKVLPLVPGVVNFRSIEVSAVNRIEISNARSVPSTVELRLLLASGARLVRADHLPGVRNGHPTFTLTVPAGETAIIRYRTGHTSYLPVSP